MDGGIRVMADPEQQGLTIEVIEATDRTVQAMGNVQRMIGGDPVGFRSDRRKCVRTITAQDARHSPEHVGHYALPEAGGTSRIERMIVIIGHAGHHQGTVRSKSGLKRPDQSQWPVLNWTDLGKRYVHEKHAAGSDPQFSDLGSQFQNGDWLTAHHRLRSSTRQLNDGTLCR
jgi:hypothetical protein